MDPDPVLTPAQTYQKLIRNGTEKVRISEMARRLAGVMLVPYPPGIPVRMPGERLGDVDSPIIRLLLALEKFGKQFPGFEREVHGIEVDAEGNYWMRSVIECPGEATVAAAKNTVSRLRPRPKNPEAWLLGRICHQEREFTAVKRSAGVSQVRTSVPGTMMVRFHCFPRRAQSKLHAKAMVGFAHLFTSHVRWGERGAPIVAVEIGFRSKPLMG